MNRHLYVPEGRVSWAYDDFCVRLDLAHRPQVAYALPEEVYETIALFEQAVQPEGREARRELLRRGVLRLRHLPRDEILADPDLLALARVELRCLWRATLAEWRERLERDLEALARSLDPNVPDWDRDPWAVDAVERDFAIPVFRIVPGYRDLRREARRLLRQARAPSRTRRRPKDKLEGASKNASEAQPRAELHEPEVWGELLRVLPSTLTVCGFARTRGTEV